MEHSGFVHLHVHSQYSLLDGASRIEDLINKAREYRMPALALTDHGNMFGAVEFYTRVLESGVKPIVGYEAYVAPGSRKERKSLGISDASFHLTLLAKDEVGYRNLMKLATSAYLEGFYYRPRIDKEILSEHREGLIALSGCLKGEIPQLIKTGNPNRAREVAGQYRDMFGSEDFYLELQDHGIEEQKKVNEGLIEIGKSLDIPLVATNDCHYIERSDSAGLRFIERNPKISLPEYKGARKYLVKRFPYKIIYLLEEKRIIVLAVIHGKRSPILTKGRIDST